MADMKRIDADTLVATVQRAAESAKSSVEHAAEEAIAAIRDVSAAQVALSGKTAGDLVANATIAHVREVTVDRGYASDGRAQFNGASVIVGSQTFYTNVNNGEPEWIKPGKYRALFLLLKVDE